MTTVIFDSCICLVEYEQAFKKEKRKILKKSVDFK